jgi:4-amino-4-deoxy-L-arabinose transferase-like glycosyltransferase
VLIVLCAFLFLHRLADRDLWSSHEARAAQNAQSILSTGDWLMPRLFDLRPELQKPPLFYWLVAGVAQLTGGDVNAWAVRLPAAMAAAACVLVLFVLGKRLGHGCAGLIAGTVLATAAHFTWMARVGRIDMPLTLMVTITLAAYFLGQRSLRENRTLVAWSWLLCAYLAIAAAVLLKGPIGIVLPASVVAVHCLLERWRHDGRQGLAGGWRRGLVLAHRLGLWWGIPLIVALTLPWFLWVDAHTNGELFRVFFWYHNIERGFGGSGKLASHPWWFYGPRLLGDFLPWSPVLLVAIWYYFKNATCRRDPLARFGLIWLVTITALLSLLRFKRADYLLPAYPGAALFLGCIVEQWTSANALAHAKNKRLPARPGILGPVLIALIALGTMAGWWVYVDRVLPAQEQGRGCSRFAAEVRKLVPPPMPVILFCTKAHLLTFHLGQPVDTLLEWENLDWWAGRPGTYYVITTPVLAKEAPRHLKAGRLVEVLRSRDLAENEQERELVLLRTQPHPAQAAR